MYKKFYTYLLGIIILAFGISFTQKASLGISPPLCLAFLLSNVSNITYGTAIFVIYFVYVIIQILLVSKVDLNLILQIPFSMVFSYVVDFINEKIIINSIFPFNYLILVLAIILTGIGAAIILSSPYVKNPADSLVSCLSKKINKDSGTTKMIFDISCVLLCLVLGLILNKPFVGLGIGTAISMLTVGLVIKAFNILVLKRSKK